MPAPEETTLAGFADAVAAAGPAPGGGAVAAVTAALSAALVEMVSGLAVARATKNGTAADREPLDAAHRIRSRLLTLAAEDEGAFRAVVKAKKAGDDVALRSAWTRAAEVPAELIRICRDVAQLAGRAAREGAPSAIGDAVMAAILAAGAAAGSHINLRLNVQSAGGPARLRVLADEASLVLRECQRAAVEARMAAEERLTARL